MFIENLTQLGFTEKEAQVYLMLFRTGPAPASTLAQRVQMKRVSIYTILETLCSKGVVSYEQTEMGRRYIPHDPECIYDQLEQERANLQVKLTLAKNCVEALQSPQYFRQMSGQRVHFFKGEKSIRRALEIYLEPKKSVNYLIPSTLNPIQAFEQIQIFINDSLRREIEWRGFAPVQSHADIKKHLKGMRLQELNALPQNGHLFAQADRVFFLSATKKELELMLIIDSDYAKLLDQVIFERKNQKKTTATLRNLREDQQSVQPALL